MTGQRWDLDPLPLGEHFPSVKKSCWVRGQVRPGTKMEPCLGVCGGGGQRAALANFLEAWGEWGLGGVEGQAGWASSEVVRRRPDAL